MSNFDLHTHLLPGVDDGPRTMEESIDTLRRCHEDGTRGVVMTPHMFSPFCGGDRVDSMRRAFDDTLSELRHLQTERHECAFLADMEFFPGAENYLSPEFLAALDRREVLTLAEGPHLLLEFGAYTEFDAMLMAARKVIDAGFVPLLAHVERYSPILRRPGRLAQLVEEGCIAQVNAGGLLAPATSTRNRVALGSLEQGLASVVASDVHDTGPRGSRLGSARVFLAGRFSEEQVEDWLWARPRALVQGGR